MSALQVPVSDYDHVSGPRDARVVLVEYGDYQCPYCGQAEPAVLRIRQELGSQVAVVFRNFPLPMHAQALPAALVAEFGGLSADHLECTDAAGVEAMARAGTTAVLLPGSYYALRETHMPPIEAFREHGVRMAVEPISIPALRRCVRCGSR